MPPGDTPPRAGPDGEDLLSQAFFRDRNVADDVAEEGEPAGTILRRLALCLGVLVGGLALVDVGLRVFLPRPDLVPYMDSEASFYTVKLRHYLTLPAPELLVLGSSRARRGVNAGLLADELAQGLGRPVRTFSMAMDGASVREMHAFVQHYMQDPPPPYVILCVSGVEVLQYYDFHYAPRFMWRLPDFVRYLTSTWYEDFDAHKLDYFVESVLCRFWYLFENRDALERVLTIEGGAALGLKKQQTRSALVAKGGDDRRRLVLADDGYYAVPTDNKNFAEALAARPGRYRAEAAFSSLEEAYDGNREVAVFEDLVAELQRRGCKVLIAEMPPSPQSQKGRSVLGGVLFRGWMTAEAGKLGVPFVPFDPAQTKLGNEMYGDISHLSNQGAWLYTTILARRLLEDGFLEAPAS